MQLLAAKPPEGEQASDSQTILTHAPPKRLALAAVAAGLLVWFVPLLFLLLAWAFEGFSYQPGPDEIIIPRPPGWRVYLLSWPWLPVLMGASVALAWIRRARSGRPIGTLRVGDRRIELGTEDAAAAVGGLFLLAVVLLTVPHDTLLYFVSARLAVLYPLGAVAFAAFLAKVLDLLLAKDVANWPETRARSRALEQLQAAGLLEKWASDVRFDLTNARVVVYANAPDASNVHAATKIVQEALGQQGDDLKRRYPHIEVHHHSDTSRSEPPNSVSSLP